MKKYSFRGASFRNEMIDRMSPTAIIALDAVRWTPVYEFPDHYSVDDIEAIMETIFIAANPGYRLVGRLLYACD